MHRDIRRCRVDYYARLSKTTLYECGDAMMPKCVNRMNTHTYGYLHRIRTHTCGSETRVMHVKSFIRRSTKSKSWMLWTEHKYARKSNYMDENTHNTWKWRRQRWWLRSYTAACQRPHHQTHTLLHAILWPTKIPHSWRKRVEKDKCMVCVCCACFVHSPSNLHFFHKSQVMCFSFQNVHTLARATKHTHTRACKRWAEWMQRWSEIKFNF